jgi:hypothetical protein
MLKFRWYGGRARMQGVTNPVIIQRIPQPLVFVPTQRIGDLIGSVAVIEFALDLGTDCALAISKIFGGEPRHDVARDGPDFVFNRFAVHGVSPASAEA